MVASEPDDMEMLGSFRVIISASGAGLNAVANAYICGRTLERAADLSDFVCPHSDSMLRPIGLDSIGDVVLQIYRGEKKCDAAPAREIAHFDPARYSKDPIAAKSIAWMRDVAQAITAYHDALISGVNESDARDTLHDDVYGIPQESR